MTISNMIAIGVLNPNFGGVPSAAQIAAGAGAVFYDIAATTRAYYVVKPDLTGFNPYGTGGSGTPASAVSPKAAGTGSIGIATPYARQDHAHPINTPVDLGVISTALLTWNATTNLTSDGLTLASGVAPSNGINTYSVATAGTTNLDGISSWRAGGGLVPPDLVQFNGTVWTRIAGSAVLGTFTTKAALDSAIPPASTNGGERANVGASLPYAQYISDGTTWLRLATNAGLPVPFAGGTPLLANGYDGNTLVLTGTPALNLPTGLVSGYGNAIKGAFTLAGGLTIGSGVTDNRSTTGVATCSLVQTAADGSTYDLWGSK